jgi:L-serine dehydratase
LPERKLLFQPSTFVDRLEADGLLDRVASIQVDLYGSLALTGKGHATDRAILLGLSGERPDRIDPDAAEALVARIRETGRLTAAGRHEIPFDEVRDLRFLQRERLPHHSNGMRFTALDESGEAISTWVSYSVGGGAVVDESAVARNAPPEGLADLPYRFSSAEELLGIAEREQLSIAQIARSNERAAASDEEIDQRLDAVVRAMSACIDRGMAANGILPGGLKVRRRAPALYALLTSRAERALADPLTVIDWVNLWALAVISTPTTRPPNRSRTAHSDRAAPLAPPVSAAGIPPPTSARISRS